MDAKKADGSAGEEGVRPGEGDRRDLLENRPGEGDRRPGNYLGDSEMAREFADGLPVGETGDWKQFEASGKIEDYLRYRGYH